MQNIYGKFQDFYHFHSWYQTGKEYTAAVEAKQVAQQEAQRAQFIVEKAKQERQQRVVQAEGEARAAQMISFYLYLSNSATGWGIQISQWKISFFKTFKGKHSTLSISAWNQYNICQYV